MNSTVDSTFGIMSILIIIYRIIRFMIPMIKDGIKTHNWSKVLSAITILV